MNLSQKTTLFANRRYQSGPPDTTYRTITITPVFSNGDTTVTWNIQSNQDKGVTYNYQYPGISDDMVTDPTANGSVYFNILGEASITTNLDPTEYPDQGLVTELQIVTAYGILTTHPLEIISVDTIQIEAASGELQANISTTAWGNTQVVFSETEEVVFTSLPTVSKDVEILLVGGGGAQDTSSATPTLVSGPETDGAGNERIKFDQNINSQIIDLGGSGGGVIHSVLDIVGNAIVDTNTTISVGEGGVTTGEPQGGDSIALNQTTGPVAPFGVNSNSINPGEGASPNGPVVGTLFPAYFNLTGNTDPLSNVTAGPSFYAGNSNHVKVMRYLGPNSWTKPFDSNTYIITDTSTPGNPSIGIQFTEESPTPGLHAIILGAQQNGMGVPVDITGETIYYGGGGGCIYRTTSSDGIGVDYANASTLTHPMDCLIEAWPGGGGRAGYNAAYQNGTAFEDKHAHTALIPYATNPVYCDGSPYKCTNLPSPDNNASYYENAATGLPPRPNSGAGAAGAGIIARADVDNQFCLNGESSINFVTFNQYVYGENPGADGIVIMSWVPEYSRAFKPD